MVELYQCSREGGADAGLPILECKQKFSLWNRSALSKPGSAVAAGLRREGGEGVAL